MDDLEQGRCMKSSGVVVKSIVFGEGLLGSNASLSHCQPGAISFLSQIPQLHNKGSNGTFRALLKQSSMQ